MVEIDDQSVRELQDGKAVVTIPRAQVFSIELAHGRLSERPLLHVLLFVPVLVFGFLCLAEVLEGNTRKFFMLGMTSFPMAVYGLWHAFRRGPVLLVTTSVETRRLIPHPNQLESLRHQVARFPPLSR